MRRGDIILQSRDDILETFFVGGGGWWVGAKTPSLTSTMKAASVKFCDFADLDYLS